MLHLAHATLFPIAIFLSRLTGRQTAPYKRTPVAFTHQFSKRPIQHAQNTTMTYRLS